MMIGWICITIIIISVEVAQILNNYVDKKYGNKEEK